MKEGDPVECIETSFWIEKDDIKIGDILEVRYVNKNTFRFVDKTYLHYSKSFKLVEKYKIGDECTIPDFKGKYTTEFASQWADTTGFSGDYVIKGIGEDKVVFDRKDSIRNHFIISREDFEKYAIIKNKKMDIVGYELIKDLPNALAGTKLDLYGKFTNKSGGTSEFHDKWLSDTEWFKPIYKPKQVELKNIGSKNATLVVKKEGIRIGGKIDTIDSKSLEHFLLDIGRDYEIGSYNIKLIDRDARVFLVGCIAENNRVSYNEVKKVLDTYNSL